MRFVIFFSLIFTLSAKTPEHKDLTLKFEEQFGNYFNEYLDEKPILDKNAKQKLLFIIHRHGERTLAIKFPTDPYALNASLWPDGDGQLTIPGKLRMYNLGLYLKERYKNFITSDVREVKVRSSGLDRCIESAELVSFAMYPPKGRWLWNENNTFFQPIPISSTIPNTDPSLNPHAACKNGWAERAKIFESDYVQRIDKNNQGFYKYLSKNSGLKVSSINDAKAIFDALIVEKTMHYKLPNWSNPIVLSKLEKLYDQSFYIEFMTRKAQMFRTGVFLNELQERILDKLRFKDKKPRPIDKFEWDRNDFEHYKIFIYSTHDSFISALLTALGVFNPISYPPFGATILFEVYQNDLEHLTKDESNIAKKNKIALENIFIKFFYLKHTESKYAIPLTLNNCKKKDYCSFTEFFESVKDLILTKDDWTKKCDE